LFLWVFLKALGGKATFLTAYFLMGVAAISLWIFAPFLAMIQVRSPGPLLLGAFVLTGVYGLSVTARTIQQAFALSNTRMTIALSAAVIYIGCFLYLWM
jgi:xanthosine utilization system XapX-like protein